MQIDDDSSCLVLIKLLLQVPEELRSEIQEELQIISNKDVELIRIKKPP